MPGKTSKFTNLDTSLEDIINKAIVQGVSSDLIDKILVKSGPEAEASIKFLILVLGSVAERGVAWGTFEVELKDNRKQYGNMMIAQSLIYAIRTFDQSLAFDIYDLGVEFGFITFPKRSFWNEKESRWVDTLELIDRC